MCRFSAALLMLTVSGLASAQERIAAPLNSGTAAAACAPDCAPCLKKVCIAVPDKIKIAETQYACKESDICLPKCSFAGHKRRGCDKGCDGGCGRHGCKKDPCPEVGCAKCGHPRTVRVLMKRVVSTECPSVKCEVVHEAVQPKCVTPACPEPCTTAPASGVPASTMPRATSEAVPQPLPRRATLSFESPR